jgi:CubicO group peptidase (beta-lactamase class C family)
MTGRLLEVLIEKGIGNLTWKTTIAEVFPEVVNLPGRYEEYLGVTIEQLMAHTSGMPGGPIHDPPEFPSDSTTLTPQR